MYSQLSEYNGREIVVVSFVVARGDGSEVFEFIEETLDGVALLIEPVAEGRRITSMNPERVYVDRGYRGHDAPEKEKVFISGQKTTPTGGLSPTIKRELKRRSGIEPVIGHMKNDGHMGRRFLIGTEGDAINVILAAAGHNLRLLARWLLLFLFQISQNRCRKSDGWQFSFG